MNCIFLRRGYPEIDKGPDYSDNFADNDWATIIAVCQAGLIPDSWKVGDQKAMTINGTSYPIDIIGIQHDDYSDGSGKAPFTFQMHNIYGTSTYTMHSSNTNSVSWDGCNMRNNQLPAILAKMPSEIQEGIKVVNKLTSAGSKSATIKTTADKLFLLSEIEVFGSATNSKSGEGSRYAYYSNGGSRKKTISNGAQAWWLRSPRAIDSESFCVVTNSGGINDSYAGWAIYLSFAFCF